MKVAVTVAAALRVMLQAPVPLQPPDQPPNEDPGDGAAVRVTALPPAKLALQVEPQLIPEGALVTVPEPVPPAFTVS